MRQSIPTAIALAVVLGGLTLSCAVEGAADVDDQPIAKSAKSVATTSFLLNPIGKVKKTDQQTTIVLEKKFQPGLLGLDQWSHVWVMWWFDKNDSPKKRAILQVHPRGNRENPLTGVFATRSPFRPNLIAMTLCKIISVDENVVTVEAIDAFDGTPVLDLKPYALGIDTAKGFAGPSWRMNR